MPLMRSIPIEIVAKFYANEFRDKLEEGYFIHEWLAQGDIEDYSTRKAKRDTQAVIKWLKSDTFKRWLEL